MSLDKNVLKKYDKFYFTLRKSVSDEKACAIINSILEVGFIESILFNIKNYSLEIARLIIEASEFVNQFNELIRSNIKIILMVAIFSEDAARLALETEDKFTLNKVNTDMGYEVLDIVFTHSIQFPANKELCQNFIRKHATTEYICKYITFYCYEDIDLIMKSLQKNEEDKSFSIMRTLDMDSSKLFTKLIKFFNLPIHNLCKLSYPEFTKVMDKLDLDDPQVRRDILGVIMKFNRWDLLPFFFKRHVFEKEDWFRMSNFLYSGDMTKIFFLTLFNLMEKYNYDIINLKNLNTNKLCATPELKIQIQKLSVDETLEAKIIDFTYIVDFKLEISHLFDLFCTGNYSIVINNMFLGKCTVKNRFHNEREFVTQMIESEEIIWNNTIKNSWRAFCIFTDDVITQNHIMDKFLLHYNSAFGLSTYLSPIGYIQLINQLTLILQQITMPDIIKLHHPLMKMYDEIRFNTIKKVRKLLQIELPYDEEYILPENPTLEDLFKYVYQYGRFCGPLREKGSLICKDLVDILRNMKLTKISDEVQIAFENLVSLDSICSILRKKKIVNFL
jgi:hypothetical protein